MSYSLTTAQWQQQCRHAGFSSGVATAGWRSPTAGMSEHIILATLPGQAVSAVTFTAPSEPVLGQGQALTDNGDYPPTGLIAQVSPNSLTPAGRRHGVCFTASRGDALPVELPPVAARSGWGRFA